VTHHTLTTDFLVAGGGMAGLCAAVSAARLGARVVLVQDRSVLGGNASSEIKMHIVGADCHGKFPGRRESGLIEELKLEDAARNPHRSYSQWDLLLYEKAWLEPNLTLLLDADLVATTTDTLPDGRRVIRSARVVRNLMEETYDITASFFADCTGDGRLGAEAGADFHLGRESRTDHGESLAQPVADRHTLGSSILITGRRHDTPQPFIAPSWIRKFTAADFKHRPIHSYEYGYWWFEWGGQIDSIKDNETIRHELLRIALGVWDYVKNSGDHPAAAHWALDWVGSIPGKRESRRFLGPHVLTQHDVQGGTLFPDRVAYGGWAIDLHPPSGVDVPDEPPYTPHDVPHLYTIPLRSYHSRNVANLFFAGRNISATHVAFASTRAMATCALGGQAIGTAAALWRNAATPDITALSTPAAVAALQQSLLRADAFLPGLTSADPTDLARTATITATAATLDGLPAKVIDGHTRDLRAAFGPWSNDSTHAWEAPTLPATLVLELPAPTSLRSIQLTFDSGFTRELILTPSEFISVKTIRGPQPELVRHYRLKIDGRIVLEETANHLRHRIHKLDTPVTGARVELEILATHGAPLARVFELRLYA
jgi:hypothetical protein